MAIPTFIQETRFGRTIFQIQDGCVCTTVRPPTVDGALQEHRLDLRRIDPSYVPQTLRFYGLMIYPALTLLFCAGVLWILHHQTLVPKEALGLFYQGSIIGFGVSLIAVIRWSRRVEYYEFRDHWGKSVLYIICEPKQAAECTAFIQELVARIEIAQSGLSPEDLQKEIRRLERESTDLPSLAPWNGRWNLSITLGAFACGFPLIPGVNDYLAAFVLPIVIAACTGGVTAGVLSFMAREPKRWWSLVGLALSLVPPYFY